MDPDVTGSDTRWRLDSFERIWPPTAETPVAGFEAILKDIDVLRAALRDVSGGGTGSADRLPHVRQATVDLIVHRIVPLVSSAFQGQRLQAFEKVLTAVLWPDGVTFENRANGFEVNVFRRTNEIGFVGIHPQILSEAVCAFAKHNFPGSVTLVRRFPESIVVELGHGSTALS